MQVTFQIGDVTIESEWNDSATARAIYVEIPLKTTGSYWGEEFYFEVPVTVEAEPDASDVVAPGTVAYWPPGRCLCLFWGPTPASRAGECRAADAVNVLGTVTNPDDLSRLRASVVAVTTG